MRIELPIGAQSAGGQVTIVDEDRLCYVVKNISRGAAGLRTISKQLLDEYIDYFRSHPNSSSADARDALCGQTEMDRFEYGYTSTLTALALLALQYEKEGKAAGISSLPHKSEAQSLQQIYYGAPGTGKSYTINTVTAEAGDNVIRTTFHPDSDYSTFVGAYKPTKKSVKVRDMAGHVVTDVNEETGKTEVVMEDRIVYRFVAQAFIQAYTRAWRNLAATAEGEQPKPVYLVIEEINRGNCAQIFGDLFQLLDRNDCGFSDYPIIADSDMSTYLHDAMRSVRDRISDDAKLTVDSMYKHGVVDDVINGNVLLLPSNLYIWATMNTSDQSLFPIDSAFKRRWDWTYMPISDAGKHYTIRVDGARYDWWQFLEKINAKIGATTNSEDKKLGYFFCKADAQGEISAEKFVGKVIFYLWNDVFKDYEFSDAIFNDEDGTKLTFDKFHKAVGQKAEIVESKVQLFLHNLGLKSDKDLAAEAATADPQEAPTEEQ